MGILDELLAGVVGGASGQRGRGSESARPPVSTGGGSTLAALLPVVLALLASRGGSAGQTGPRSGGGLGDVLGQVLGGGQGGTGGGIGDILGGVLGRGAGAGGAGGGLGGLLEQMQRAGLGDQARSWVGTGPNMPISPEAVDQIFGHDGIEQIARQAGLTPEQTRDGLSDLLPEVVDRVTPQGDVPEFDQLTQSVDDMRRRLGA
jgi:uncharacterized protein YidB (DUF937 family)